MILFPDDAAAKTGFDVVRRAVGGLVRSDQGRERIAHWQPVSDIGELRRQLDWVEELAELRASDELIPYEAPPDVRSALRAAAPEHAMLSTGELLDIARLDAVAVRVQAWCRMRSRRIPHTWERVETWVPGRVAREIEQAIDDDGSVRDSASSGLRRVRGALGEARARVRTAAQRALRRASAAGYATEDQPTIRGGRVVIPVRAEARRKVEGFVHDESASGQTVYIEPAEALAWNNDVRTLELEERREMERIRRMLTERVRESRRDLASVSESLAELDEFLARALLAHRLECTRPEMGTSGTLRLRGARNAALMLHFQEDGSGRSVVPMDLDLDSQERMVVISGPNAGGKSVAMKTVGLLALMMAHGLLVPLAPGSRIDLFEALMVDIGDEQSMENDLSTFTSHLTHLKHISEQAGPGTLVLIDEIGTGTDPEAGAAVAQALLEHLLESGARVVATTHFGLLKVFAHEAVGAGNASMKFDEEALEPTYELLSGTPGSSFASEIALRVGLLPGVIDRARALMGSGKVRIDDLLADLLARNRHLESLEAEAEEMKREAEATRREWTGRMDRMEEEASTIREKALREAQDVIKGANRAVERAVREIRESQAGKETTRVARERLTQAREQIDSRSRSLARKRGGKSTAARKPTQDAKPSPGDQVRIDDGDMVGEVMEISEREALVAAGSLQLRVHPDRLTRVGGPRHQQVHVSQPVVATSAAASTRLDIRGKRVDEGASALASFLDTALGANLERVEIIHGKGTGALRQVVADVLEKTPFVAHFEEAPIEAGGAGVTVVTLGG
ncbi:MAG: endonuclease MutS2 [Bacteroidetes bacterium CG12_big_fil_rev_8_21_14_0_65_60_17]|nr:MAG: endonuclease MutS2 [Bacteroidetes bacterium CG12_big_fil_rev_8_21_14_0_65_60_17]